MKKCIITTITLCILILNGVSAQCPNYDIWLANQQEVDDFADIYPDCTELLGDLVIRKPSQTTLYINDLSPLSQITSVAGSLHILDNDSLVGLTGLENIASVGVHLRIWSNDRLVDLSGLNNLTTTGTVIGNRLEIQDNNALLNLNGLNNLTSCGGQLYIINNANLISLNGLESLNSSKDLSIRNNDNLVDLSALSNLTSLGGHSLDIRDNASLVSLNGLDNIISIADSMSISDNPNLSVCHVESICNHIINGNSPYIGNNASGCNSTDEIITNCSSTWEGYVQGNIYLDENTNCQQDLDEPDVNDWLIKIEGEGIIEYAYTYDGGNYIQPLDAGAYKVTAMPPNALWEAICPNQAIAILTDQNPTDVIDFGASTSTFCPFLEIDITTPNLRRCFTNQYYVRYCNSGTAIAENAYVEVQLDPFFTYENSSIVATDLGENLYAFDLGNIGIGECDNFQIEVYVDCDSTVIGQTHCMEAHIFPDSICTPIDPLWDESSIVVNAECLGDSIEFTIKNIGSGDMSDSLEYMVIEEDLIWHKEMFQLDSGDSFKLLKPANGEYYRIEAQQSPRHPGNSMPSVFVEGCGTDDNEEFSLGFVNYYVLDEGNTFVSIDCQENVGSYDPNDKQAFPVGVGDQHYITNNTDLEYMIRFQNTGTGTAFNIVIRDTISPHLNIETLRPGVASHSYTFDIEGANVAVFTFENIMLPDSNVNEVTSHGFVKFNIQQQANNPVGTVLENKASIYFDFNTPIITNAITHTIDENYFTNNVSIVTPPEVDEAGISVNVFPNPFGEYTIFEIEGNTSHELRLSLYDMMGREVLQQHTIHQQYIKLYKNNLPSGIYVFRLTDEKQALATGKLVIE